MYALLHSHSMYSIYDGSGDPDSQMQYAKEIGLKSLAITDHGTLSGLVDHYLMGKKYGVKPILGMEAYFQPKFNKEKDRFHMVVLAKTMEGYRNLCRAMTDSAQNKFYRYPVFDFDTLRRFGDDLYVTSGCLSGIIPRYIQAGKMEKAHKLTEKFVEILDNRFLYEVQPFRADQQKLTNEALVTMSRRYGVPIIMTGDNHFTRPENYESYQMKFKLAGSAPVRDYEQYKDRYMQSEQQMSSAWKNFMKTDGTPYLEMTQFVADACNVELTFNEMIPKIDWGQPSQDMLRKIATQGLKKRNIQLKKYYERLNQELEVIFGKGFEDYFLLCYDIVHNAKKKGIRYGFGRGSVCGSVLAYAIGLTEVDPIVLGTDFERFLRPDRTTTPDIDMDFDSARRGEVIDYILTRYAGQSAPIATFGYYKSRNLINDLAKHYQMPDKDREELKQILEDSIDDDGSNKYLKLDENVLLRDKELENMNEKYENIITHFCFFYNHVRFIGRHAAGVAITADKITNYVPLMRVKEGLQTSYDLDNLSHINIVKMDILGLSTASVIADVEKKTKAKFDYKILEDRRVMKRFRVGDTDPIFQFEKRNAKEILRKVRPTNIQDIIACNTLNRPAAIKLGIINDFVAGKEGNVDKGTPWYQYTKDAYGTIIYQEHVMRICRGIAHMEWSDIDKIIKTLRQHTEDGKDPLRTTFVKGAMRYTGMKKKAAEELYQGMTLYSFNKGHSTAYSLIAFYMQYLRTYYPLEFYWALLRNEDDAKRYERYKELAAVEGVPILLPNVNNSARTAIARYKGGRAVQEGLNALQGVGIKSALAIEKERRKNGKYTSKEDLMARVPKRQANSRVIDILDKSGAFLMDTDVIMRKAAKYNLSLANRGRYRKWVG